MTAESLHPWPVPPPDAYTVDDLFALPDLPPHTELIDGSLVSPGPQRLFHMATLYLLESGLRRTVPDHLVVGREMTVVLGAGARTAPEPDLFVVRGEAVASARRTRFEAADVLLVVEVVSPDSEARDRIPSPVSTRRPAFRTFGWWRWLVRGTSRWCIRTSMTR
ncbi:Uma2 family endonuclease [Streptomyces zagrosensis]|uniref:Uma2 family endonuclease n=1 Tax=Streptomyces zagrosensis TaxID=1042984 RepID=A0A7W9QDC8_9ACTN|nr:Uma2 family endonuclease [Streptomyces zagrosensis]